MHQDPTAQYLGGLDPDFAPYVLYFINAARQAGVPLVIISGRRSSTINREVGGAERSLHLYGFAFDTQVQGYTREQIPLAWWQALGVFWESMGGRWGGRFNPPDVNHFDAGYAALA